MRNLSLYQIGNDYQGLFNQLYDEETGEVNMEVDKLLSELSLTAEKKCIEVAKFIRKIQSEKREIEYLKEEITNRDEAYKREINKMSSYLQSNMERLGIKQIKCPYFTINIKVNPYSTEISDESLIPERFMRTKEIVKIEVKPDKSAIKDEFLSTGLQVPGTRVQQNTKLEITIDKL